MMDSDGLISLPSRHDVAETARRLRAAVQGAGLMIFAEVDHGQNAVDAGMALRPTLLLIFGNGRGGTPVMQARQQAGIDLPLKALIWRDEAGQTWLTYNDAGWIAERHGLGEAADTAVAAIMTGMDKLSAAATA
jgi:uncharacterized protein (DUF302 family)